MHIGEKQSTIGCSLGYHIQTPVLVMLLQTDVDVDYVTFINWMTSDEQFIKILSKTTLNLERIGRFLCTVEFARHNAYTVCGNQLEVSHFKI